VKHRRRERIPATRGVSSTLLAASALAACATPGEGRPQANTAPVPDATRPDAVSVFGVFRNGRMSPEAWEDFGKVLSTPFSQGICKAAYDVVFTNANPELASAIDDYAKENGVSDELLAKFAPLAKGDTILVIAIDGQLPKPAAASTGKPSKPAQDSASPGQGSDRSYEAGPGGGPGGGRGMGHGGGGRGMGRGPSAPAQQPKPDKGFWELTASLYSVRLRQWTKQVELKQQGPDIDGDLKLFAARVGTAIPGVPCRGWDSTAKIDADSIRKLEVP